MLRHFNDIQLIERAAINERREAVQQRHGQIAQSPGPRAKGTTAGTDDSESRIRLLRPGSRTDDSKKLQLRYIPAERGDVAPAAKPIDPSRKFWAPGSRDLEALKKKRPKPEPCDTVGLALSGGGIRSASFCLGVLQALNQRGVINSVDYLSTVSGGGYIGTCMTAAMSRNDGAFPFDGGNDHADNPKISHLRNYSNYLLPRGQSGWQNFSEAATVIVRGLLANLVVVAAFLLAFALFTVIAFPKSNTLDLGSFLPRFLDALVSFAAPLALDVVGTLRVPDILTFGDVLPSLHKTVVAAIAITMKYPVTQFFGYSTFSLTLWLVIALGGLLLYWVLLRSFLPFISSPSKGFHQFFLGFFKAAALAVVALTIELGLIALVVHYYGGISAAAKMKVIVESFETVPAKFSLLLCYVTFLSFALGAAIQGATDVRSRVIWGMRSLFILVLVMAFLDLQPVIISQLIDSNAAPASGKNSDSIGPWLLLLAVVGAIAIALLSSQVGHFLKATQFTTSIPTMILRVVYRVVVVAAALVVPVLIYAIYLYLSAWAIAGPEATRGLSNPFPVKTTIHIYGWALAALFVLAILFKPNAYSLHQIYRDRLSFAFLFETESDGRATAGWDRLKLSELKTRNAPYHIINTAMNVQGSEQANLRGRDADFFSFTPNFVGSDLTLYAPTSEKQFAATGDMEAIDPQLDVAAAMATSGAAVSANMGTDTLRLMSPTLALLNIRLGYWILNPWSVAKRVWWQKVRTKFESIFALKVYLLQEMLNLLNEKSRNIYLTDGGHIENLGVYELLKRGCQLIIVVDAECDPDMSSASLLKLERYARIDLGVRIDLPWEKIARRTQAVNEEIEEDGNPGVTKGPHCAIGRIWYTDKTHGVLLYIKSSLTGDEKDYVIGYKKRFPRFPHETTGDQFFTEEQLEVYRALGFHAAIGFLIGTDDFAWSKDIWPTKLAARDAVMSLIRTPA